MGSGGEGVVVARAVDVMEEEARAAEAD